MFVAKLTKWSRDKFCNTSVECYKIYNFTLTVSLHYLIKLKTHMPKRHILKSVVTVFYYSAARISLWAKWAIFTHC